jgi:hypothetical protein
MMRVVRRLGRPIVTKRKAQEVKVELRHGGILYIGTGDVSQGNSPCVQRSQG